MNKIIFMISIVMLIATSAYTQTVSITPSGGPSVNMQLPFSVQPSPNASYVRVTPQNGTAVRMRAPIMVAAPLSPSPTPSSTPTMTPRPSPSPTPSPTPTPTIVPTPTPCMSINMALIVSGTVKIPTTDTCSGNHFESLYVDDIFVADYATGQVVFNSAFYPNGNHVVTVTSQSTNPNSTKLGSASINLVFNNTVTPSPTPTPVVTPTPMPSPTNTPVVTPTPIKTPTPVPTGTPTPTAGLVSMLPVSQTIPSLTGSPAAMAAALPGVDTNPADFGHYITSPVAAAGPNGIGMFGGPLLDDRMAASVVMITPRSKVELSGTNSAANLVADNYYQTVASTAVGQTHYLAELAPFWAAYNDSGTGCVNCWAVVAKRVDGAIPIVNPTAAEILQWAANKWGLNPRYLYTEACDEGDYNSTALGDNGTSSGMLQLADRGANHAWSGFDGLASQNLSRESVAFNADFFAASRWASFNVRKTGNTTGLTGETPPFSSLAAVQSWFSGGATAAGGTYQQMIFNDFISGWQNAGIKGGPPCWVPGFFNNVNIPIVAPVGTMPHE